MEGYNFLKNPKSQYGQPQELTEVAQNEGSVGDLISDYCDLYKDTMKEIYEQKIFAFKEFYSHCLFNKDGIGIGKSDFFLIQSFIISDFKSYMTNDLQTLGQDITMTFSFDKENLSEQESIIGVYGAQAEEVFQKYLADNMSEITDNFKLKKYFSKLENTLNKGETEMDLFKFKFLSQDPNRSNFKMPRLNMNYNSFAIKALRGLASLNLVTLISELLIEGIFNFINDDVLVDFKKMEEFAEQLSKKDSYFESVKDDFDYGVNDMISDLELDLLWIYDKIIESGDDVERRLFLYQIELKFGALTKFLSDIDLKTIIKTRGNHATFDIDNKYKSTVLKGKGYRKQRFLMKKWSLFNAGKDYNEAKKTTIYGPDHSKWLYALKNHGKEFLARKETVEYVERNNVQYEKINYELLGVANKRWIFLEQLMHEGLKFGIDYDVLKKKKDFYMSAVEGKMIEDGKNDSWSEDRIREYIIKEIEGKAMYFDENDFFSKKQAKFYFDVCGNTTEINEDKIFKVGIKILDLNEDSTNDLILLDSLEFQVSYYEEGSNAIKHKTATEWISGLI